MSKKVLLAGEMCIRDRRQRIVYPGGKWRSFYLWNAYQSI